MKRLVLSLIFVLFANPVFADDSDDAPPPANGHAAFTIQFENDIFFDTDQHYTSGVGLNYTTAPQDTPDFAHEVTTALPFLFDERNAEIRANYEIAQDIFTPRRTGLVVPDPTDRPYAGYLYAGFSVLSRTETNLDQLELQAGVIGPASLAQDGQNWVHTIIGDHKALGWHYQLRDEPGLELTYQRAIKIIPPQSLFGVFFDIEPHYGAAVGNVYDYVNVGAMARVGVNLPDDFGPPRLEPSLPGSNFYEPNDFSAYVFGGVDGRAVGRNVFLDGNSFEDSPSVVKKPFVGDLQIGAAIALNFARLSFTHVFRTREFKTQPSPDQFGSVNLTFLL